MIDCTDLYKKNIFEIKTDGVYNIYIVFHDHMKKGDWGMRFKTDIDSFELVPVLTSRAVELTTHYPSEVYKIVATTDETLINDGVQALDKDFLYWLNKYKLAHISVRNMTGLCGDCYENDVHCGCETPEYCEETYRLFYPKPEKPKPPVEKTYTEKEVENLLIQCQYAFRGGELWDYHSDDEVKEWFKKRSKNK